MWFATIHLSSLPLTRPTPATIVDWISHLACAHYIEFARPAVSATVSVTSVLLMQQKVDRTLSGFRSSMFAALDWLLMRAVMTTCLPWISVAFPES